MSNQGKTVVLLTNLGSVSSPTYCGVRRFLKEFLSDRRVIQVPKFIWWFVLNFFILTTRPLKVKKAYQSIWQPQGSPLLVISKKQVSALQKKIDDKRLNISVISAMRYGNPSLSSALNQLKKSNIEKLLILPLYPQYSATTTASTFDAISALLSTWQNQPDINFISRYYHYPNYIAVLAKHIENFWQHHNKPDVLLMSFHGLPQSYVDKGDPYYQECINTATRLASSLNLQTAQWRVSFQSRLGRTQWLSPYTNEMLTQLAKSGVARVHVICPGFSVDCLETLEEIALEGKAYFLGAGGKDYQYIPCLNDSKAHIDFLAELIDENLANTATEII